MIKKISTIAITALLLLGLSGCQKTGTMSWVEWNPYHRGIYSNGTCRIGMVKVVNDKGDELPDRVFRRRDMSRDACYELYVEGKRYTWGKK